MEKLSLKELAVPLIKSIDSFNYLLKSHHRRTAVIAYNTAVKMGLSDMDMIYLVIAAAMHDIGALSVQERDMLINEDVTNPEPHCVMGYRMLQSFDVFREVAQIIKHHHIKYNETDRFEDRIPLQSHIIHLADRVDILINPDKFILNQKRDVTERINDKCGTVFHPDVCGAFMEAAKADIFWIEINNMTIEQLFNKICFDMSFELTLKQTIQFALTVSRIIDFRSRYTAAHSYTVGHLAYTMGKYLGFNEEDATKLLIAGYFHDIGKIGIDTAFIEKEGPLTDDEYNHVKLHSYYTGQILNGLGQNGWFADIINWAQYHHEKANGKGYPYAISGDQLSTGTKIISYADIISALMEDRPYRKSMGMEKTFQLIGSNIAADIDTEMFHEFEKHRDELEVIVDRCSSEAMEIYSKNIQ